jgi:hypothetical protein
MKTIEEPRTRKALEDFSVMFIMVMLLILSNLGATAMLAGSAFAMCVYTFFFKESMRDRSGSLTPAIYLAVSIVAAVAVAVVISLIQGRWH